MTTVVNKAFLPFLLARLLCRRRMQVWIAVLHVHNPGSYHIILSMLARAGSLTEREYLNGSALITAYQLHDLLM